MTTDDVELSSEPRQTDDDDAARKARKQAQSRASYLANREKLKERRVINRAARQAYDHARYFALKAQKQEYDRAYRAANRERIKERKRREYETGDPEKRRANQRVYREANRDKIREYYRSWSDANRGEVREYARNLYYEHHAKRLVKSRTDYRTHRKKRLEKARVWQEANPEKVKITDRLAKQKRRAILRSVENTFTRDDWQTLVARSKRCHWCQIKFTKTIQPTHDHVIPIIHGGGNTLENSVCACRSCNSRKQAGRANPNTGQGILL